MIDGGYAVAGAPTGFVVGRTGVGGGALMTPVLLLFFGVAPATAIATDLWFAAATKLVGARVHHTAGNVDWQVARRMWLGSLPMALAVVLAVAFGMKVARVEWLTLAVGVVVLVTAVLLLAGPLVMRALRQGRWQASLHAEGRPGWTVACGAVLGLFVALTSVGAGTLGSIMLMALYRSRMTPHRLVATDIVHAIPLAMVAGTGYLFAGMVDGAMLFSLLLGSVPAVVAGSLLAGKVPPHWLRAALAVVLASVAIKLVAGGG